MQDNDHLSSNHPFGQNWFSEMSPDWQQNAYEYNNHYENYLPVSSLQSTYAGHTFEHLNYSYSNLDMPYKNGGNFGDPIPRQKQHLELANNDDLSVQNRALVIDHRNNPKVNDDVDHYHPLQAVGILFNGSTNEHAKQQRSGIVKGNARLMGNAKRLQENQIFLRQAGIPMPQEKQNIINNQLPINGSKINIYPNSNWKQHNVDESGLATLPRRIPFPGTQPNQHPYNIDHELLSNCNPQLMAGYKMNSSQSSCSVVGIPGL